MIKIIITAIMSILLSSCEYDYDIDLPSERRVVVNSILNPDSTIRVNLSWSDELGDNPNFDKVENFSATIYESGVVIYKGENLSGEIGTNLQPKCGHRYRLEVEVPNYGLVSGETYIPLPPKADAELLVTDSYRYNHYKINSVEGACVTRAIYIKSGALYENGYSKRVSDYYANNGYCDQFNTYIDNGDFWESGSNMFFDGYIRISYNNLQLALPLNFSVRGISDEIKIFNNLNEEVEYHKLVHHIIEIIAPSDEYDRYTKSLSLQQAHGVTDPQIFSQLLPINMNIENGLGIFAGYSSTKILIDDE